MRAETSSQIYTRKYTSRHADVPKLLDAAGLTGKIPSGKTIVIKPNLVNKLKPPITTPVELIENLVDYLLDFFAPNRIVIAEGCGSLQLETPHVFKLQGYSDMAAQRGIQLIDLNEEELVTVANPAGLRWREMFLPRIAMDGFLLSVPVLKAHSLAGVTLTMKNMMGLAPPSHYRQGGAWKKASFHSQIQESLYDLNCCRTPDFTLLDATIGMQEAHLWGPTCNPPHELLIAGYDPVAVDAYGTSLLNRDWEKIGHIQMAHGTLGLAEPIKIIHVD
jgi:uncharacterized protein (DUF362 family)